MNAGLWHVGPHSTIGFIQNKPASKIFLSNFNSILYYLRRRKGCSSIFLAFESSEHQPHTVIKLPFGRIIYGHFFLLLSFGLVFLLNRLASMESVSYFLSVTHLIKIQEGVHRNILPGSQSLIHCGFLSHPPLGTSERNKNHLTVSMVTSGFTLYVLYFTYISVDLVCFHCFTLS